MPSAADALGILRLLVAAVFPGTLAGAAAGGWAPLVLFGVAAASDVLDGIVARRGSGPTAHGAALDGLADVVFVLAATGAAAHLGMVPLAVPVAIAAAFGAYASVSLAGRRAARTRIGHAAGVLNYALVALVAGAVALPGRGWTPVLALSAATVVTVNVAAVGARIASAVTPARVPRAGGTGARSPRSSA